MGFWVGGPWFWVMGYLLLGWLGSAHGFLGSGLHGSGLTGSWVRVAGCGSTLENHSRFQLHGRLAGLLDRRIWLHGIDRFSSGLPDPSLDRRKSHHRPPEVALELPEIAPLVCRRCSEPLIGESGLWVFRVAAGSSSLGWIAAGSGGSASLGFGPPLSRSPSISRLPSSSHSLSASSHFSQSLPYSQSLADSQSLLHTRIQPRAE
jgi:hypothetical protein